LARHGDQEAENRILGFARSFGNSGSSCEYEFEFVAIALSYIQTDRAKREIALGLRNEDLVFSVGGNVYPRRAVYVQALWYATRDEPAPPMKDRHFFDCNDAQLDAFEKWCSSHWGETYPSTPRRPATLLPEFARKKGLNQTTWSTPPRGDFIMPDGIKPFYVSKQ